jgi:hypothetical protein
MRLLRRTLPRTPSASPRLSMILLITASDFIIRCVNFAHFLLGKLLGTFILKLIRMVFSHEFAVRLAYFFF